MKASRLALCVLLLQGAPLSALAAVTATLDRDHIDSGDTVQLVLQHDGRTGKEPDLEPLKKDFDVLGTSSGTSMQFTNGHFTSQLQLQITLSPKHDGAITIPALQWDGDRTDPLQLTVGGGGAGSAAANNGPHVFLESSLDTPHPYVQGASTLTVKIYTDQPLYQGDLQFSGNSDVAVQVLGKDQQGSETRDGHRYQVIERHYLLQPQRSGSLSLDGPQLDAQITANDNRSPIGNDPFFANSPFSGMMRTTRPLHVRGKPVTLDVRPRPDSFGGGIWLPATDVKLEETWKPDTLRVHVGEPLTRHLQLSASGATGAQLPELVPLMALPDGLKAYPDQAKLDTTLQGNTILGMREQDVALIAQRAGHYELPALRLRWWDTSREEMREAVLPARTIDILPAEGSGAAPAAPAPAEVAPPATGNGNTTAPYVAAAPAPAVAAPAAPANRVPWPWISLALALLWLTTLAAWAWQHRRSRKPAAAASRPEREPAPDLKAVLAACRCHRPDDARRALLDWARQRWPERPPLGLKDLAVRIEDPALAPLLQALDRACYHGGDWNGETLAQALSGLGKRGPRSNGKEASTSALSPLYP